MRSISSHEDQLMLVASWNAGLPDLVIMTGACRSWSLVFEGPDEMAPKVVLVIVC